MTRNSDFKAVVRSRMARTGESYVSARAQLLTRDVLHVTNGDAAAAVLRDSGVRGDVLPWRDVLHVGPVPDVGAAALRRERARFLAARGWTSEHDAAAQLADRDTTLARHRGPVALWFEADLYDQLQLCQILATLRDLGADPSRITLVCVGEHPGIGHFGGLGELSPPQLAALRGAAVTLSGAALDLAAQAWATFRAPQPDGHAAIAATVSHELRFVPEAFDRLGREFPSTRDGLSLTERRILAAVAAAEGAPVTRGAVFAHVAAKEVRPFLGDWPCFWLLDELAASPRPLLTIEPAHRPAAAGSVGATSAAASSAGSSSTGSAGSGSAGSGSAGSGSAGVGAAAVGAAAVGPAVGAAMGPVDVGLAGVDSAVGSAVGSAGAVMADVGGRPDAADIVSLTDDGRRVLDGAADRIAMTGLDRWIGGVHLSADLPSWRWDEARERLVLVVES